MLSIQTPKGALPGGSKEQFKGSSNRTTRRDALKAMFGKYSQDFANKVVVAGVKAVNPVIPELNKVAGDINSISATIWVLQEIFIVTRRKIQQITV